MATSTVKEEPQTVYSPDELVDAVIAELCVSDPKGLDLPQLWEIISKKTQLDEFTKKLAWHWLLQQEDVLLYQGSNSLDKSEHPDPLTSKNIRISVTDDRQSLYLTGAPADNHHLGDKPYDLLKYIARSGPEGISSVELIKQSGQDKRSLTGRLQKLVDQQYIKKFPTVADGGRTHLMIHFRFVSGSDTVKRRFGKWEMLQDIIDTLAKAPQKTRVISDLIKEIYDEPSRKDRRRLLAIIAFLCENGITNRISVVNDVNARKYSAIQLIKELSDLDDIDKIKEQVTSLNEDDKSIPDESTKPEVNEMPTEATIYNQFFPATNQIFDLAKRSPGITTAQLEDQLYGKHRSKLFALLIEGYATNEPDFKTFDRYHTQQVIGSIRQDSKQRFYRIFTIQDFPFPERLNLKPNYLETFTVTPLDGQTNKSLLEISASEAASPYKLRFRPSKNDLIVWSSMKGFKRLAIPQKTISKYEADDGTTVTFKNRQFVTTGKSVPSEGEIKIVEPIREVAPESKPSKISEELQSVYGTDPTDVLKEVADMREQVTVDKGPEERRKILVQLIDENKAVVLNNELCEKVSKLLDVDYTIDRKTLQRDSSHLESKGIVTTRDDVSYGDKKRTAIVFCSIKNPPTENDINAAIVGFMPSAPRKSRIRIGGTMNFNDVHFFAKPVIKPIPKRKRSTDGNRVLKKRKKHRLADLQVDVEDDYEIKEEDALSSLMTRKRRKKHSGKSTHASANHPGMKKKRTNLKLEDRERQTLVRAVIISQTLSPGQITDWSKVTELFDEKYPADLLRRQWGNYRRSHETREVRQIRSSWEAFLMQAIERGDITEKDLVDNNLGKMVSLWSEDDPGFSSSEASLVLLEDYATNLENLEFSPFHHLNGPDIFKDTLSLIDKESLYNRSMFSYPIANEDLVNEQAVHPTELQLARARLKAYFATSPENNSREKAEKLIAGSKNTAAAEALAELENEKSVSFLGSDSDIKFSLTDKLLSIADSKLDRKFFEQAAGFYNALAQTTKKKNGLVMSNKSPDGCFASLLNLLADQKVKLTRVDQQPDELISYSTKSQDRSKLESDFIVSSLKEKVSHKLKKVSPPSGAACSRLWIDLNGDFNAQLWINIVCQLVTCIVFRPGAQLSALCYRMYPLLEPFEVKIALDWLVARNAIRAGPHNGYWAQRSWYLILD